RIEGNAVNAQGQLRTVAMQTEDGRIASLREYGDANSSLPLLMAGFIDIHVHGGGGSDTMEATADAFEQIASTHARFGTTALLLTTVTESPEKIAAVLDGVHRYMALPGKGAQVLGVHLEGPFIHPSKAGAQRPDLIMDPNEQLAHTWFSSGVVRMITLAPERPGAHAVSRLAAERGVVAAVGHTTAQWEDMQAARAAGFSHVTHLCNAMPGFHHRDVGPIGYTVMDDAMTADLICDGIHVSAAMVAALCRSIGEERLMLITDAIAAAAAAPGRYELGGLPVWVEGGACRLQDGTLAGSVLTMAHAVRMVQRLAGVSMARAQRMASENPARRLSLARKGRLEEGYDADVAAFSSEDFAPVWTMVGGRTVYEA
ncbi:MAG: N-acetylglucosamine-6-phosphate deacetylase, partial [Bacilli bacterium]